MNARKPLHPTDKGHPQFRATAIVDTTVIVGNPFAIPCDGVTLSFARGPLSWLTLEKEEAIALAHKILEEAKKL